AHAQLDRLAVMAETLRSVEVGQPLGTQALQQWAEPLPSRRVWVAHEDAEAVAVQVAGAELVAVAADGQQANAVAFDLAEAILEVAGYGHHLARDGVAVLQAGGADVIGSDTQPAGELADEILRSHGALFDPEIEEAALAGGRIGGDFLNLEVL